MSISWIWRREHWEQCVVYSNSVFSRANLKFGKATWSKITKQLASTCRKPAGTFFSLIIKLSGARSVVVNQRTCTKPELTELYRYITQLWQIYLKAVSNTVTSLFTKLVSLLSETNIDGGVNNTCIISAWMVIIDSISISMNLLYFLIKII